MSLEIGSYAAICRRILRVLREKKQQAAQPKNPLGHIAVWIKLYLDYNKQPVLRKPYRFKSHVQHNQEQSSRASEIIEHYLQGASLRWIGNLYGISGERVRQIIKKNKGGSLAKQCASAREEKKYVVWVCDICDKVHRQPSHLAVKKQCSVLCAKLRKHPDRHQEIALRGPQIYQDRLDGKSWADISGTNSWQKNVGLGRTLYYWGKLNHIDVSFAFPGKGKRTVVRRRACFSADEQKPEPA